MKIENIFTDDDHNETGLVVKLSNGKRNAVSFGYKQPTHRIKCELQAMIKWIEDQEKNEPS